VNQLQKFYSQENRDMAISLTGSSLTYDDLISQEDKDFWEYLCRKDFRRLEKLMTQNIGEGHFIDDTDDDEESEEAPSSKDQKSRANEQQESDEEMDEHDKLMEQMMHDLQHGKDRYTEKRLDDIERQILEVEEQTEKEKDQELAKFGDNNFWKPKDDQLVDVDELLAELDQ
jgi:hypothetical protein